MGGTVVLPVAGVSPRSLVTDLDAIVGMFPHGMPSAVWEWDVAPYDLMMREAGGWASDLDGAPLRFNQPDPRFQAGVVFARSSELGKALVEGLTG